MDIATGLTNLMSDLHGCRRAITYRGGEISATAGFKEVAEKIASLPASSSMGTVVDETVSSIKVVPVDSTKYCYLKSIGGMTYKCENLMPFPYIMDGQTVPIEQEQQNGDTYLTVNSDKSISMRCDSPVEDESFTLSVSVPSSNYYLTIFKSDVKGDDSIVASSDVGNIPFGTSVLIPQSTGITQITLTAPFGSAFSCTLKIILSKYPYFEGLKDTKTTAVKVYGSNLFDYTKSFTDWKILNYSKEGDTITINHAWGQGFSWRYKFTDKPQICTLSVDSSSTSADGTRLVLGYEENGVFTARANFFLGREATSVTSTGVVNAIRWDYPNNLGEADPIVSTLKGLRINYGSADCGYQPFHESITYEIPEALQGTGKGIDETYHDYTDYENGKAVTKVREIDLGNLAWSKASYGFSSVGLDKSFVTGKLLCADYKTETYNNVYNKTTDMAIAGDTRYSAIIISDSRYDNAADFKNAVRGKKLLYALAEPTSEPLPNSTFVNLLEVEGGGFLEFVTDSGLAPHSTVMYQTIV